MSKLSFKIIVLVMAFLAFTIGSNLGFAATASAKTTKPQDVIKAACVKALSKKLCTDSNISKFVGLVDTACRSKTGAKKTQCIRQTATKYARQIKAANPQDATDVNRQINVITISGSGGKAGSVAQCANGFFGLVPWYQYMNAEFSASPGTASADADPCDIKCFNFFTRDKNDPNDCGQWRSDVPGVLLAIVDDLLRIAGLVAVAFVLVGAFQLVTSQGNAEQTAKARSTIINALLGVAIAIVAVAFVSFIGNRLGG